MNPTGKTNDLPWGEPCKLSKEEKPYTALIKGNTFLCTIFKGILELVLQPSLEGEELVGEFFQDGDKLIVKVRAKWNEWLEGLSLEDLAALLFNLRSILDASGFKTAKLQCSIHQGKYKEKTNIRIVYNRHWRRYENYEIFFRNKTQSSRKTIQR